MRELTQSEYQQLVNYITSADIADISIGNTQVFWDDTQEIMGKYQVVGNDVYLPDLPLMLKELTPCVIHELTHQNQRRELGIAQYHLLKMLSNELEDAARKNEWLAESRLNVRTMEADHPDQNRKWYHRFVFWEK